MSGSRPTSPDTADQCRARGTSVSFPEVDRTERDRLVDVFTERIGLDRFESIVRDHADTAFGRHKPHYLDLRLTLTRDLTDLLGLGLAQSAPRAVLDIGTGPGLFAYLAAQFGHRVLATEKEDDESLMWSWWRASPEERRERKRSMDREELERWLRLQPSLYGDLTRFFGVERTFWTVEPDPAPQLGSFDLIAARSLYFNRGRGRIWSASEWRAFTRGLQPLLLPAGRIFLSWATDNDSAMADAADGWRSAGARVEENSVLATCDEAHAFASAGAIRTSP